MDEQTKGALLLAGLAGAAALALGPGGGLARITSGPLQGGLIRAVADKWGRAFGVSPDWIVAIAKVESGLRPGAKSAKGARDDKRGGAWGAMQVTLTTAQGLAPELAKLPAAAATYAKWDGTGEGLLDADVGVMFGAYLLAKLSRQFGGDFAKASAAYNQGPGTVARLVAAGTFPAGLTVHGQDYVAKTDTALQEVTA
jgi:soluble lytic murein transglycosylase-like protein